MRWEMDCAVVLGATLAGNEGWEFVESSRFGTRRLLSVIAS